MSPNKVLNKKCGKSNIQQPPNSWLFLLKTEALESSECYTNTETLDIETLRHPRTGEQAIFLFSPNNSLLYEVLTFSEAKTSWFIDESVKSDGNIRLSTPIDPIFLVLPYLKKHCNIQAMPLDQLLHDKEYPATERLLKNNGLKHLTLIADKKGSEDLNAFKYSEGKSLAWLKRKTERVADLLKEKNIHLTSAATSATFNKIANEEFSDSSIYLHYAAGIVSEYLVDDLRQKLFHYLNLPEDLQPILKRKSNASDYVHEAKKIKSDETSTKNSKLSLKSSKAASHNAKEKLQTKAAVGTKSITSYFKKC